ncbi:class I SAM-dependent methyltransferase [Noviherbaspirillum galbum]|uniref:Class I SAM-dependent methyltransferase n=1 Tax=Noviherbaspirillum galbum TaxID=2709383 RepID=A0A6B3SNN9_9BURK|nr:class I SAM-dependent methyltransferase [Noviherbaspirillum galbum]NEX60885.1 class I SAM-dependent methyltransferase [Noviherbaspirillum galbum]
MHPFEHFPKTRPPLPREIEEIYSTHYKSNRDGDTTAASMAQRLEAWMHRKVAADIARPPGRPLSTLEVGAGTLNQLQHEPEVGPYDIVEPFTSLYAGSPRLARVRHVYGDIAQVPESERYDRITSVATFEHILNLPELVARCGLLLAKGGSLRAAIPSEGTVLWALGWKCTTGLEFRMKYGLDYGLLMKHEHVNSAREIREVLEFFFADVRSSAFGLAKPLSLYQFYECREPKLDRCAQHANLDGAA